LGERSGGGAGSLKSRTVANLPQAQNFIYAQCIYLPPSGVSPLSAADQKRETT
jgi:hypothetical protein